MALETDTLGLTRYDYDPDAIEWARSRVEKLVSKYREFECMARNAGNQERAGQWRKFANLFEMELIGGTGCTIRPFDPRAAEMHALLRDGA